MSSQLQENNSELKNSLKERIKMLMTEDELKRPYSFATRVGLSKGTFTGIWVDGRTSLQHKTAQKIVDATGVDIGWLMTGTKGQEAYITESVAKGKSSAINYISKQINNLNFREALTVAYTSTEGALVQTFSIMPPDQKAHFLVEFVKTLIKKEALSQEQSLLTAIFTIELSLYESRQEMSLSDKIRLIMSIYEIYYKNPEVLKTATEELDKYRKQNKRQGDNSDRSSESG